MAFTARALCNGPEVIRVKRFRSHNYLKSPYPPQLNSELFNNAGGGGGNAVAASDDGQLQTVLDVNLLGPARCVQAAAPYMLSQGSGVIVNIGSVAGEVAVLGIYSAAKFGLRGLNDALRREFRHSNIAVVLIEPGFIRTQMTEGLTIPMAPPEAVARAIVHAIQRPRRRVIVPWYYAIA